MGGFDLPPPAATAAVAAAAAADEPLDFSFDMDFGATPAPNPVPQPDPHPTDDDLLGHGLDADFGADFTATPAAVPAPAPNTDIDMANLAREFDLPDLPSELHTGVPATPATPGAAASRDLKDPLFDLDAMDFGLEPVAAARPAADPAPDLAFDLDDALPPATPAFSLEDDPFALPALDGLPAATPAPAESAAFAQHNLLEPQLAAPSFDLDLADHPLALPDLDNGLGDELETAHAAPATEGIELSPAHMEMETKLDLAIAYQEIGDKEGARELLDEVIKGGTGEQIGRANAMRAALA